MSDFPLDSDQEHSRLNSKLQSAACRVGDCICALPVICISCTQDTSYIICAIKCSHVLLNVFPWTVMQWRCLKTQGNLGTSTDNPYLPLTPPLVNKVWTRETRKKGLAPVNKVQRGGLSERPFQMLIWTFHREVTHGPCIFFVMVLLGVPFSL